MKKLTRSLWLLLSLTLCLGMMLAAQQQPAAPSDQQSPSQPTAQQPQAQTPDHAGQPATGSQAQSEQSQEFTGTIMKVGDKYMLQDASGKTYDIDNQAAAKEHEGKQVRIQGVLDPDGKTIRVK